VPHRQDPAAAPKNEKYPPLTNWPHEKTVGCPATLTEAPKVENAAISENGAVVWR
jgi:hypothetical protein